MLFLFLGVLYPTINAATNVKDILGKEGSLSGLSSKASTQSGGATSSSIAKSGGASSLNNYSATFSSTSFSSIPVITQFGLIKMTGTEGNLQNGYTIGKDAKGRASASLDYITRDENGKPIAEIKDKNGNTVSKNEAKEQIKSIQAERRLVLSPNPRLKLNDEQFDKVVRATMSSYSESFGKEFNYFYAIHNNTSTPHAHIIMTSNHPDGDGIKMYKDELFELKMNFEDNLKELVKDSGIKIKDESALPVAKQIANFIGAIPDASMFNQNKFLAHKISKKFDLEYDSKQIGSNPEKLADWFKTNDKSFKEYFMSATNKDAFLFQEYLKVAEDLSQKYDLGLDKNKTSNIKDFQEWLKDKQEIFLAERIAQDKNIILQKEDVSHKNKLYKWFKENESEVKEWNEKHKYFPSKQMSSLAQKYSEMVDIKPNNFLESRKDTREFVKNYTRNPLMYSGESRKSLHDVFEVKKEQYKNELLEKRISQETNELESKRLDNLQNRLIQGQEISQGSLRRYNLSVDIFSTSTKSIKLDGINFNDEIKKDLILKIEVHKKDLDNKLKAKNIDEEHHKNYIKKANTLSFIVSKSNNISISALENIGLDKDKDLKDFKIEKVEVELEIINFKDTDLKKDAQEILETENINNNRPLMHQIQQIVSFEHKYKIKADENIFTNYKNANEWIDEHKDLSSQKTVDIVQQTQNLPNLNQDNYINQFEIFIEENKDIYTNLEDFYTLLNIAIENKNIEIIDGLYNMDTESNKNIDLLELKFLSYAEALDVNKEDVYRQILSKDFNLSDNEINQLEDLEKVFDTYFEFSQLGEENEFLDSEDIKKQIYIKNFLELLVNKYDEKQWQYFKMDDEHTSEQDVNAYFDATKIFTDNANTLNELISNSLDVKSLENEISQSIANGDMKTAQELIQDERLETNSRISFQYAYENILGNEHILDEIYEKIIDDINLEEKTYEVFKEDTFLIDMKKISLEENMLDELTEELRQEELEEHELTLGE